jgi:general stress protein 26
MTAEELKKICVELMETSPAAYVTTIGEDGYPHTRAMFNLRNRGQFPRQVPLFADHGDDFMVVLTTNTSSAKIQQIRANPKACVYYCHPTEFEGVMFAGDIEIVEDSKLRDAVWNEGWEKYYPQGPDDPDHTVLRIFPKYAQGWYVFRGFEFELK